MFFMFCSNGGEATLDGLIPYSTYNVSVSAANDEGGGKPTYVTQKTSTSGKQHGEENLYTSHAKPVHQVSNIEYINTRRIETVSDL